MLISRSKSLIAIMVATLIALLLILYTHGVFRIAFGILVLLFFPGFTFLAVLFTDINKIGRLAYISLSLGISLAIIPVLGFILHFSGVGLGIYSIVITVTVFILLLAIIGIVRGRKIKVNEYSFIKLSNPIPPLRFLSKPDKILTISLLILLVVAAGTMGAFIFIPNEGERYSEFFILDAKGSTENYPENTKIGEPLELMVSVINHEDRVIEYRVVVEIEGNPIGEFKSGNLAPNSKWQELVKIVPSTIGSAQKVEFWLFRDNEDQPYNKNPLSLLINITG